MAYHAFAGNVAAQQTITRAAVLFLFGIIFFTSAYVSWFVTNVEMDHSLRVPGEEAAEEVLLKATKSVEACRKAARRSFVVAALCGAASFALFVFGMGAAVSLSVGL